VYRRLDYTGRKGTRVVRGKGEGSIYRRSSDGRWVAQIEAGRAPSGRRRYARAVRRTRKDAQKALKDLIRSADAGLTPGQSSTETKAVAAYLTALMGAKGAGTQPGQPGEGACPDRAVNRRGIVADP
jgi:hypothetical protein